MSPGWRAVGVHPRRAMPETRSAAIVLTTQRRTAILHDERVPAARRRLMIPWKGTDMRRLRDRGGLDGTRYSMREKLLSIGDDSWIETEGGERAFKVNGKALRLRDTLVLESPQARSCTRSRKEAQRARQDGDRARRKDRGDGEEGAGRDPRPLCDRRGGRDDLSAKGNIVDHEYAIERDGDKVAEVSKRWFRVRDTYGIEVAPGQDDALILAITVCIDQMGRG